MIPEICRSFEGKLIASCQAQDGDPFRDSAMIARFAKAAVLGGAAAIRADSPEDVRAVRACVPVPILGIRKRKQQDGAVLITPSFQDARELFEAGANMIAVDCTTRGRSLGALARLQQIRDELRIPVAADIATVDEALLAAEAGADFVLSTMRGYTQETADVLQFDPEFIQALVEKVPVPVIAEGRIHKPEQAREAIAAGAFAVVVGTAISRPREIARWFANAVETEFAVTRQPSYFIGIDLGGTNTKFGLVSHQGKLRFSCTEPTPVGGGRSVLLDHLKRISRKAMDDAAGADCPVRGIGIATAGWVNTRTGQVVYATENLPGWTGTPVAQELRSELHLPVAVENDANALALAERHFGAGRALRHFVCLTLGTGVGGGCFIDGKLNRGAHFLANAIGHLTLYPDGLPCSCGKRGCLEAYTNAAALLRYAENRFPGGRELLDAVRLGDAVAIKAVKTLSLHLAHGCAAIIQLLDPEAIIVSGGIAQNNPFLLESLSGALAGLVPNRGERRPRILASELGYHGGVLGAAAIALEQLG